MFNYLSKSSKLIYQNNRQNSLLNFNNKKAFNKELSLLISTRSKPNFDNKIYYKKSTEDINSIRQNLQELIQNHCPNAQLYSNLVLLEDMKLDNNQISSLNLISNLSDFLIQNSIQDQNILCFVTNYAQIELLQNLLLVEDNVKYNSISFLYKFLGRSIGKSIYHFQPFDFNLGVQGYNKDQIDSTVVTQNETLLANLHFLNPIIIEFIQKTKIDKENTKNIINLIISTIITNNKVSNCLDSFKKHEIKLNQVEIENIDNKLQYILLFDADINLKQNIYSVDIYRKLLLLCNQSSKDEKNEINSSALLLSEIMLDINLLIKLEGEINSIDKTMIINCQIFNKSIKKINEIKTQISLNSQIINDIENDESKESLSSIINDYFNSSEFYQDNLGSILRTLTQTVSQLLCDPNILNKITSFMIKHKNIDLNHLNNYQFIFDNQKHFQYQYRKKYESLGQQIPSNFLIPQSINESCLNFDKQLDNLAKLNCSNLDSISDLLFVLQMNGIVNLQIQQYTDSLILSINKYDYKRNNSRILKLLQRQSINRLVNHNVLSHSLINFDPVLDNELFMAQWQVTLTQNNLINEKNNLQDFIFYLQKLNSKELFSPIKIHIIMFSFEMLMNKMQINKIENILTDKDFKINDIFKKLINMCYEINESDIIQIQNTKNCLDYVEFKLKNKLDKMNVEQNIQKLKRVLPQIIIDIVVEINQNENSKLIYIDIIDKNISINRDRQIKHKMCKSLFNNQKLIQIDDIEMDKIEDFE